MDQILPQSLQNNQPDQHFDFSFPPDMWENKFYSSKPPVHETLL